MLNCYCQLSSSVIFRQYGVSQSECKIDRPRPRLPRDSPRPHTEALGTRLIYIYIYYRYLYIIDMDIPIRPYKIEIQITTGDESDAPAIFDEL